jgi:hypothetical protein
MSLLGVVERSLQLFARAPLRLTVIAALGAVPTFASEALSVWSLGRALADPELRALFALLAIVAALLPRFTARPLIDLALYDFAGQIARDASAGGLAASARRALSRARIGISARVVGLVSSHAAWALPTVVAVLIARSLVGRTPAAQARELGFAMTSALVFAPFALWIWIRLVLGTCAAALDPALGSWREALRSSSARMKGRFFQGLWLEAALLGGALIPWGVASLAVTTPSFELLRAEEVRRLLPDLVAAEWTWLAIGEVLSALPRAFTGVAWTVFYQEGR